MKAEVSKMFLTQRWQVQIDDDQGGCTVTFAHEGGRKLNAESYAREYAAWKNSQGSPPEPDPST